MGVIDLATTGTNSPPPPLMATAFDRLGRRKTWKVGPLSTRRNETESFAPVYGQSQFSWSFKSANKSLTAVRLENYKLPTRCAVECCERPLDVIGRRLVTSGNGRSVRRLLSVRNPLERYNAILAIVSGPSSIGSSRRQLVWLIIAIRCILSKLRVVLFKKKPQ